MGNAIKFIVVVAVLAALAAGCSKAGITGQAVAENGVREISVDAFQFGYKPDVIRVAAGENVLIRINNLDTLHGMRIPSLGVSGMDRIEFKAAEKGEYEWRCNNMCGSGHMAMKGKIIVE